MKPLLKPSSYSNLYHATHINPGIAGSIIDIGPIPGFVSQNLGPQISGCEVSARRRKKYNRVWQVRGRSQIRRAARLHACGV